MSVVRHRTLVLALCLLTAGAAALYGRRLFDRLSYGGFRDPTAESTRGADLARAQLGEADPDVAALYRLPDGGFDDPSVRAALTSTVERVSRDPQVSRVVGASGPMPARFLSSDRKSTFVVVSLRGRDRDKVAALPRLRSLLRLELPGQTVSPELGGLVPTGQALTRLARESLKHGEAIALPLVGVLLVVIFGSVVAALLPLAVGSLSIVLALAVLALLSQVLPVDAFAVNVVTVLGLGVAIDYALFIVDRYREERRRGEALSPAISRALETAGRSVLFSAVTVATSLMGLMVFHQPLLRSIAVGGILVTLLAALLSLVVLPAALALIGDRLERGRLPLLGRRRTDDGIWRRLARAVIRRRVLVSVSMTLLLLTLAAPFRRVLPSRADVRALPAQDEARRVAEEITAHFPQAPLSADSLLVIMDDDVVKEDRLGELFDYSDRLRHQPDVARVESILSYAGVQDRDHAEELAPTLASYAAGNQQAALRSILHGRYVLLRVTPKSTDAQETHLRLRALRQVPPPRASRVLLFGQAAQLDDFAASMRARAPWMIVLVGAAMFVILFFAFQSLILPLKAMVMTALSLTASFGATVFVFQDGRFERLLGYHSTGTTDASLPVVMFAVVFGLSMDYEVLILNRVREAWIATGDNRGAIVEGLARTGRLVTGAALLMIVVFSAFAAAPLVFVKALGLGMALAVALDATVVRMLLVPSTMALLGRLNWWRP
jgi:trehalose monomycolate/heme transporter